MHVCVLCKVYEWKLTTAHVNDTDNGKMDLDEKVYTREEVKTHDNVYMHIYTRNRHAHAYTHIRAYRGGCMHIIHAHVYVYTNIIHTRTHTYAETNIYRRMIYGLFFTGRYTMSQNLMTILVVLPFYWRMLVSGCIHTDICIQIHIHTYMHCIYT